MDKKKAKVSLPTPLARRFVGYVAGFGIAIGIGLAPFLGKIPGVDALLDVFPKSLWSTLIPFSVFLMGLIAIVVQFYSGETIHRATVRRRFKWSFGSLLGGFALLVLFYNWLVVTVPIEGGEKTIPFVIGFSKSPDCGCKPPTINNKECIKQLSFEEAKIETCWNTGLSRTLLQFSYLLLTGGFAALVGLLLLQEQARKQEKSKSAIKRSRKSSRQKRPALPRRDGESGAPPQGTS
jgi:hypothetical protein